MQRQPAQDRSGQVRDRPFDGSFVRGLCRRRRSGGVAAGPRADPGGVLRSRARSGTTTPSKPQSSGTYWPRAAAFRSSRLSVIAARWRRCQALALPAGLGAAGGCAGADEPQGLCGKRPTHQLAKPRPGGGHTTIPGSSLSSAATASRTSRLSVSCTVAGRRCPA